MKSNKSIINKTLIIAALMLFALTSIASASSCGIYFFYSPTCPHCAEAKPLIKSFEDKYPELNIEYINVQEDYQRFEEINQEYDSIAVGVPRIIINDKVFVGFTEESGELEYLKGYKAYNGYKNQIEQEMYEHLKEMHLIDPDADCEIPSQQKEEKNLLFFPAIMILLYLIFAIIFRKKIEKRYLVGTFFAVLIIIMFHLSQNLPSTDIVSFAKQFSFPLFTFIIALLDGFNPCAFAVLAILLSLLIHSKSKKKMMLIGSIFIVTSAVMYFLFIITLLTLRTELLGSHKTIVRIIAGLIAIIAGGINIKDFFFFKKGVSLTISKTRMSKIMERMRKVVNEVKEAKTAKALFVAIIGTIVLSVLVNLIELGCTLILPVQYIEFLITHFGTNVGINHYMYIGFYSLIYVIPLFAILGSFLYTFKSERMTENKGRLLKLISGLVMLGLGIILIFKPELIVFG